MRLEDAEQLARLWTTSQGEVAAFIGSLITDPAQANDTLQQVAMQIVRNYDKYDASRPFVPWAIGVAKNEVLAHRRRQATDRHVFDDELVHRIATTYEQLVEEREWSAEALAACLEQVEGRGKQALELFYMQELKAPEVARRIGISAGAVRMLLCRTREAVRKCLERNRAAQEGT
ncbi:MAG: sigma-70 family RNA polymerase sigma factor [Pirellulales bacterium]